MRNSNGIILKKHDYVDIFAKMEYNALWSVWQKLPAAGNVYQFLKRMRKDVGNCGRKKIYKICSKTYGGS